MINDPEIEPDPHVKNPLATLGVTVNPGCLNLRLASDLDAPPPFDPDDETIDDAAFEAAFEVVFFSLFAEGEAE